MKYLALVCFLTLCFTVQAQITHRDSLVGTWVCTKVDFLNAPEFNDAEAKAAKEAAKTGMLNSKLIFSAAGSFKLEIAADAPKNDFTKGITFLNNNKWVLDTDKKLIAIGQNMMNLLYKQDNGQMLFLMDETPIVLWVEKRKK